MLVGTRGGGGGEGHGKGWMQFVVGGGGHGDLGFITRKKRSYIYYRNLKQTDKHACVIEK